MDRDLRMNSGDHTDIGQASGWPNERCDRTVLAESSAAVRPAVKNCWWAVWLTRGQGPGRKRRAEGRMRPDLAQAPRERKFAEIPANARSAQEKG